MFPRPSLAVVALLLPCCLVLGQDPKKIRGVTVHQESRVPSTSQEPRVALVIGNSAYAEAKLLNPVNDARSMAEALRTCGFDVTLLENSNLEKMSEALDAFGVKLRAQGGAGLFYFAGHGLQVRGENYLVPVGAKIFSEAEVPFRALNAGIVLAKMQAAKNKVNIVILDACRNNPFARSWRSSTGGLASMDAPIGTLIAYATAPGQTAADGTGSHGLYTEHLLQTLKEPGLPLENVFKRVRTFVASASGGQQVPWENTSLTGDFYFKAPVPGATKAITEAQEQEAAQWEAIKESEDVGLLKGYLAKYPKGAFAKVVNQKLEAIAAGSARQAAARQEESKFMAQRRDMESWEKVKDSESRAALEDYLKQNPAGAFTKVAKLKIDSILAAEKLAKTPLPAPVLSLSTDQKEELARWESLKASDDLAKLDEFIKRYPAGAFTALARNKADAIRAAKLRDEAARQGEARLEAQRRDMESWEKVKDSESRTALEGYLKDNPGGAFTKLAKLKIESILAAEKRAQTPLPAPVLSLSADQKEELARWENLKASDNLAKLDEFIKRYPAGAFTALASKKADAIRAAHVRDEAARQGEARLEAQRLEVEQWEEIKGSETTGPLEAYLGRYPNGMFATIARTKIEAIRNASLTRLEGRPPYVDIPNSQNQVVHLLAGDLMEKGTAEGVASVSRLNDPAGIEVEPSGKVLIADAGNACIRAVNGAGQSSILAGQAGKRGSVDGASKDALFMLPRGLLLLPTGDLLVADAGSHTIRRMRPNGSVDTFAGLAGNPGSTNGPRSTAQFQEPTGLTTDGRGNIYVADTGNHLIRKIDPSGMVTAYVGRKGSQGSSNGRYADARFDHPTAMASNSQGELYVLDSGNHAVRKVDLKGLVTTLALPASLAPTSIATDSNDSLWILGSNGKSVYYVQGNTPPKLITEITETSTLNSGFPGIRTDLKGNILFIAGQGVLRLERKQN